MGKTFVQRMLMFAVVTIVVSIVVVFLWTGVSDYSASIKNSEQDFQSYIEKTVGYDIDILTTKSDGNYEYVMFTRKGLNSANLFAFKKWHFNRFIDAGATFHTKSSEQNKGIRSLYGVLNILDKKDKQKYIVFGVNTLDIAKYYTIAINEKEFKKDITENYFIDIFNFDNDKDLNLKDLKFYGKHDEDITNKLIINDENGQ